MNSNATPDANRSSQEFLTTKTWSSSDFNCPLNSLGNYCGLSEAEGPRTINSIPLSLHAGIAEDGHNNQDSHTSLDSSLTHFKSTVKQLFDDFYSNMNNFDEFEKNFSGMLSQNGKELDIDALIRGVVKSTEQRNEAVSTVNVMETIDSGDTKVSVGTHKKQKNNDIYPDNCGRQVLKQTPKISFRQNYPDCYALKEVAPYEQKMQQLLSDIEVNNKVRGKSSQVASTENLKKLTVTRKKLQHYLHGRKRNVKDTANVSKNEKHSKLERLDEEHRDQQQFKQDENTFLNKICHFFCKKFRKSSYLD